MNHTEQHLKMVEQQEPDVSYYLDWDDREFKTVDQLYVAYMEKACGVTA